MLENDISELSSRELSSPSILVTKSDRSYRFRQWPGRPGFNPRSSHTKDSKNGT